MKTEKAFKAIKKAINNESDYAYGFHANIAMMCYDSMMASKEITGEACHTHIAALKIGNEAATRFMKMCFDAETSQDMLISGSKTTPDEEI